MPYNGLSNAAVSGNWHLMVVEALAVGALVVAAILIWDRIQIWKRTRMIENRLRKIEKVVYIFETQESRRFILELNAEPSLKMDQCGPVVEIGACDVAETAISHIITADQIEGGKSVKLNARRRRRRKSISRR